MHVRDTVKIHQHKSKNKSLHLPVSSFSVSYVLDDLPSWIQLPSGQSPARSSAASVTYRSSLVVLVGNSRPAKILCMQSFIHHASIHPSIQYAFSKNQELITRQVGTLLGEIWPFQTYLPSLSIHSFIQSIITERLVYAKFWRHRSR